eukprot:CAMPEP_0194589808 /NCGR_PEP_ID=MMETSP0292-20121207/20896_1 /TAXON_ID=39354 /ORGANISM="Heterosigma akashiwo, Strain CCMP2393" /LENGTH=80 /DNA_ID=CAMNT_0039447173 /DNA_START=233 /DNA_END=472 /DNA_ORIENTATION=+
MDADAEGLHQIQVDRKEVVKLMLKALEEYGYSTAVTALEKESGVQLHPPAQAQLGAAVASGDWPGAREALEGLRFARGAA